MKRTGVIVGFGPHIDQAEADSLGELFKQRFPGVVFAITSGNSSIAFEYEGELPTGQIERRAGAS